MNVFADITWAQKIPVALPRPLQIEHEVLPEYLAVWSCRQLQKSVRGRHHLLFVPRLPMFGQWLVHCPRQSVLFLGGDRDHLWFDISHVEHSFEGP